MHGQSDLLLLLKERNLQQTEHKEIRRYQQNNNQVIREA